MSSSPSGNEEKATTPSPGQPQEGSPKPQESSPKIGEAVTREEVLVTISKNEGELLGVMIDDDLLIAEVKPDSPASGKLCVGDTILKVNGTEVKEPSQFSEIAVPSYPQVTVLVMRETRVAACSFDIPPERAKNCPQGLEGYSYMIVRIGLKPNAKLGLTIKDCPNGVLVSRVEPNSLAAGILMVGDRLTDIDSSPVRKREDCKAMMIRNLQKHHFFTSLIERPESAEAKQAVRAILVGIYDRNYAPSVKLNTDVREIAARQRRALANAKNIRPRKAMVKQGGSGQRVKIKDDQPAVFFIGSDTEGKELRHVRKGSQ